VTADQAGRFEYFELNCQDCSAPQTFGSCQREAWYRLSRADASLGFAPATDLASLKTETNTTLNGPGRYDDTAIPNPVNDLGCPLLQ
jgi:hypothetical protein